MFGLHVHRVAGLTFIGGPYATLKEAKIARAEYVMSARRKGFKVRRGLYATRLTNGDVKLSVWIAPTNGAA